VTESLLIIYACRRSSRAVYASNLEWIYLPLNRIRALAPVITLRYLGGWLTSECRVSFWFLRSIRR
jgi:hypothetical protein